MPRYGHSSSCAALSPFGAAVEGAGPERTSNPLKSRQSLRKACQIQRMCKSSDERIDGRAFHAIGDDMHEKALLDVRREHFR